MMKKVIYECVGNSILFILFGIMLIHPFSDYQIYPDGGFNVSTGITFSIFVYYLIAFAVIRIFVFKDGKKSAYKKSELSFADEREKCIVAESTKIAYQVLVFSLLASLGILALMKAFSWTLMQDFGIDIYSIGIALITLNLVLAMISYCIKWCVQYKK